MTVSQTFELNKDLIINKKKGILKLLIDEYNANKDNLMLFLRNIKNRRFLYKQLNLVSHTDKNDGKGECIRDLNNIFDGVDDFFKLYGFKTAQFNYKKLSKFDIDFFNNNKTVIEHINPQMGEFVLSFLIFYYVPGGWVPLGLTVGISLGRFIYQTLLTTLLQDTVKSVFNDDFIESDKFKDCMVVPDGVFLTFLKNYNKAQAIKPGFETFFNINKESVIQYIYSLLKLTEAITNETETEKEEYTTGMINIRMTCFLNYKFMFYFLKSDEATLLQKCIASGLYLLLSPIYLYNGIIERSMKLLTYIVYYILRPSKVFRMETLNILLASLLIVVNASLGIHLSSIAIIISIDFIKSFFIATFVSLFVGFSLYETVTLPEITQEVFFESYYDISETDVLYINNLKQEINELPDDEQNRAKNDNAANDMD